MRTTFEVSSFNSFRDMEGVRKLNKVGHVTPPGPTFDRILHFIVRPLVFNMFIKFEVYSFSLCRDMEGSPNLKSQSRDPRMTTN